MKIRWAAWLYLLLVSIKGLFVMWRIDKARAYSLAKDLWFSYDREGSRNSFFRLLFEQVLIPNYRLKTGIRLGRPSVTIYRKFFDLIQSLESHDLQSLEERMKLRYLLIRDGAMGDVLMLTPVIHALHNAHEGDILIDVATHARAVFDNNPFVNQLLTPKQLARGVRTYDVVVDLNGLYERIPNMHPVNAYAKAVLGTLSFDKKLELYPSANDVLFIDDVVKRIGVPFVVVHQFSHNWPNRTISSAIWAQAIASITESGKLKVIYVGTTQDLAPVLGAQYEDHRARYTLQQLSLLISRSHGFIGGDSGPSHVAATTDVPIAIFYTCAHHEARKPLRDKGKFLPIFPALDCYGCLTKRTIPRPGYYCERGDNACVELVGASDLRASLINFFAG